MDINHLTCYDFLKYRINNRHDVAIEYKDRKYTFSDLFDAIDCLAQKFINFNIEKGDICTLLLPESPELVVAFYAINKIGAIADVFASNISLRSLKTCLKLSQSNVIITNDEFYEKYKKDEHSLCERIIFLNGVFDTTLEKIKVKRTTQIHHRQKALLISNGIQSKTCLIIPRDLKTCCEKQVVINNLALNSLVMNLNNTLNCSGKSYRVLSLLKASNMAGFVLNIHWSLCNGWNYIVVKKNSAEIKNNFLEKMSIDFLISSSETLNDFFDLNYSPKLFSEKLKYILNVDDCCKQTNLNKNIVDAFAEKSFIQAFEIAEICSVFAVFDSVDEPFIICKPIENIKVIMKDIQYNSKFHRSIGQISLYSDSLMCGYLSNNLMENNNLYRDSFGDVYLNTDLRGYIDPEQRLHVFPYLI